MIAMPEPQPKPTMPQRSEKWDMLQQTKFGSDEPPPKVEIWLTFSQEYVDWVNNRSQSSD